jgi:integrase
LQSGGEGTWIARYRDPETLKQHYRAMGEFVSYDAAVKAATKWFTSNQSGVIAKGYSVEQACREYVTHLRAHKTLKSALDAEGRFNRLVYSAAIAKIELDRLTVTVVRKWLTEQIADDDDPEVIRASQDSANRNLAALKAALNFAKKNGLVVIDSAWGNVQKFKDVGRRREHFLTIDQRRALLAACEPDIRMFCEAILLTAARPGEIAKIQARDFDRNNGTIVLSGKTGRRTAPLSTSAIAFFTTLTSSKIGQAHLFTRPDGRPWVKEMWSPAFREAARKAGLPDDVVMYSLRHAAISEMIAGGMESFIVAKLAGTSTAMIDQHYGHLRNDRTREMLDLAQLL